MGGRPSPAMTRGTVGALAIRQYFRGLVLDADRAGVGIGLRHALWVVPRGISHHEVNDNRKHQHSRVSPRISIRR